MRFSRRAITLPIFGAFGILGMVPKSAIAFPTVTLYAPTSFVAAAVSPTQVNLSWKDTNTTETYYAVSRKTGSGSYALLKMLPANSISFQDLTTKASTTYTYEVNALQFVSSKLYNGPASTQIKVTTPSGTPPPPPPPPPTVVTLPIEVMGAAGTTASVQLSLTATQASAANRLWIQVHGLGYANKGSIQVNSSPWVDLNNTSATVLSPGKNFGGIGGMFSTIKLTVPIAAGALVAGTNTITFRFNGTDGLSMGFRVLALNMLDSGGNVQIASSAFAQEDPNAWTAPFTDSASISAGEQIWRTATLIHSPIDLTAIQAKCTDCHAQDGRDLKYFNYSNRSIIERCKYHGLTATQGQLVASYIRTRPIINPGRPWNPPYQPGPGLDSKPLGEWSAGAGVNAVLDNDANALSQIFPTGISKTAVATTGKLNMRELAVGLQFLDWNHWLPTTHPKDAFGADFFNSSLNKFYNGEGTGTTYNNKPPIRTAMATGGTAYISSPNGAKADFTAWVIYYRSLYMSHLFNDLKLVWTPQLAEQIYSVGQWQATKTWEMTQEFNLEPYGPTVFGATSEARTWFNPVSFMASPFMLGIRNSTSGTLSLGTLRANYLSNAWYHLQVVLDSGNRHRNSGDPVDWGYYIYFITALDKMTASPSPGRLTAVFTKGMQECNNGIGPDHNYGWEPVTIADASIPCVGEFDPCWSTTPTATKTAIQQALVGAWFDTSASYTVAQYNTAGFASPTYVPVNTYNGNLGDKTWYMIPMYRTAGVDGTLLNSICDWAATLWPAANWASLKK